MSIRLSVERTDLERFSGELSEETKTLVYTRRDDGTFRGWRADLLVEEVSGKVEVKFLLCSLCDGVLRDACFYEQDGKQKLGCADCIPWGVNKTISQINRETVNEKEVYCPFKNKGCIWTNELSRLLRHLEECGLFLVQCPLYCTDRNGELCIVERREVEEHKTCCPMRSVKCDYCSRKVKSCKMNAHLQVCDDFPIPCPNNCEVAITLKRKEEQNHLSQECPLQEIECAYSQYGCDVKFQRRHTDHHEKEFVHSHLKLTMTKMQSKIVKLEEENEGLKTKISRLIPKGCLEWEIRGIRSQFLRNENTYSDSFYMGLYELQCYIEWNRGDSHIGCFLRILKGESDDTLKWPLKYKLTVELLNKINIDDSYKKYFRVTEAKLEEFPQFFQKPISVRNIGYGMPDFISQSVLFQNKFYQDDSITLYVSVEQL